jgi:hypothetical protein
MGRRQEIGHYGVVMADFANKRENIAWDNQLRMSDFRQFLNRATIGWSPFSPFAERWLRGHECMPFAATVSTWISL